MLILLIDYVFTEIENLLYFLNSLVETALLQVVSYISVVISHQIFFLRAIGLNMSRDSAKSGKYQFQILEFMFARLVSSQANCLIE